MIIAIVVSGLTVNLSAQDEKTQTELASKTAKIATITSTDKALKKTIDAHDLKSATALIDKTGSVQGTIAKLFTLKGGSLVIFNFDREFKTAITAIVKRANFDKFPDLAKLEVKHVLITGKFIDFRGAPEIELISPEQIKII